jgi:phosphoribosylformylglycinamidine synthase
MYKSFNYPEVTPEVAKSMGMNADEFNMAREIMGRMPNYIELGCISAMWSEHCSYKSSRMHLGRLPSAGKDVVYGPGENAGVVRVDGDICICFKVESHNHPSFIEPFHGAATGVGGILRDVFTMGAKPVAAMNSLRFGTFEDPKTEYLVKEVAKGMAYYGNNFGVPTVAGEAGFHKSYAKNPLVNAFIVGIVKESEIYTAQASGLGNSVIYIGAKTGRDGVQGASMASEEFNAEGEIRSSSIPVGDPFKEKLLFDACMELMQTDALVGIQDMGAAGLASSSFEMAGRAGNGVIMHLDKVPVKEAGLTPYELMLSESQERMLLVAKKGREQEIIDIVNKWELDAAVIGEVTEDGFVRLFWNGDEVAAVEAAPLSDKAPRYDRPSARPAWLDEKANMPEISVPSDLTKVLYRLLEDPTIASKRYIYEQFNNEFSAGDAAVVRMEGSKKGLAMAIDCNSRFCYLNPREGGRHAVVESARNVAASGARPVALTNCLNFGNPEKPEVMYQLVEAIEGIREASLALSIPVVSGNVSLYNETESEPIFPTPVLAVTGIIDEAEKHLGASFAAEGNDIIFVGEIPSKIDASHYLDIIHGVTAGVVPDADLDFHKKLFDFMVEAADKKMLSAAHDIAEGGVAVALAEMGFKNGIGADLQLEATARADAMLFGEAPLMILEVKPENTAEVLKLAETLGLNAYKTGTTSGNVLKISCGMLKLIEADIPRAQIVFEKALPAALGELK